MPMSTFSPLFVTSCASSTTRFMNGSKPRRIPDTVRAPFSLTGRVWRLAREKQISSPNRSGIHWIDQRESEAKRVEQIENLRDSFLSMYFLSSGGCALFAISQSANLDRIQRITVLDALIRAVQFDELADDSKRQANQNKNTERCETISPFHAFSSTAANNKNHAETLHSAAFAIRSHRVLSRFLVYV